MSHTMLKLPSEQPTHALIVYNFSNTNLKIHSSFHKVHLRLFWCLLSTHNSTK